MPGAGYRWQRTQWSGVDLDERRLDVRARFEAARAARHELAADRQVDECRHVAGNDGAGARAFAPSTLGIDPSSPCVYGCSGLRNSSSTGATSWILPPYITATRSQVSATTARLCVMSRIAAPARFSFSSQHQIENLRLDRDVERGRRLVGDQQRRIQHERHGDHHALAHAAGKVMRILRHARGRRRECRPRSASSIGAARASSSADTPRAPGSPPSAACRS